MTGTSDDGFKKIVEGLVKERAATRTVQAAPKQDTVVRFDSMQKAIVYAFRDLLH
jgi:hypothetical protein